MSADPIKSGVKNDNDEKKKKNPGNCVKDSDEWHALLSERCSQHYDEKSSMFLTAQWVLHTAQTSIY